MALGYSLPFLACRVFVGHDGVSLVMGRHRGTTKNWACLFVRLIPPDSFR